MINMDSIKQLRIYGHQDIKIWRPTVPIHAQDNMPVYWHEGGYRCHTGG